MLSRFQSAEEQKAIILGLKDGTTDLVVGTHRLLSADVKFKRLGLLVIDEEQRFGVRHKEKIKMLKKCGCTDHDSYLIPRRCICRLSAFAT